MYFDDAVPVRLDEGLLTVRVHAKHVDDEDVPVCYCFGHTPGAIRREVTETGRRAAFATITAEVRAGHCACEVRNPKGTCCMGDVSKVERAPRPTVPGADGGEGERGRHAEKS